MREEGERAYLHSSLTPRALAREVLRGLQRSPSHAPRLQRIHIRGCHFLTLGRSTPSTREHACTCARARPTALRCSRHRMYHFQISHRAHCHYTVLVRHPRVRRAGVIRHGDSDNQRGTLRHSIRLTRSSVGEQLCTAAPTSLLLDPVQSQTPQQAAFALAATGGAPHQIARHAHATHAYRHAMPTAISTEIRALSGTLSSSRAHARRMLALNSSDTLWRPPHVTRTQLCGTAHHARVLTSSCDISVITAATSGSRTGSPRGAAGGGNCGRTSSSAPAPAPDPAGFAHEVRVSSRSICARPLPVTTTIRHDANTNAEHDAEGGGHLLLDTRNARHDAAPSQRPTRARVVRSVRARACRAAVPGSPSTLLTPRESLGLRRAQRHARRAACVTESTQTWPHTYAPPATAVAERGRPLCDHRERSLDNQNVT